MVEILKEGDGERRRSRDSMSSVKYDSSSEAGEEVSMAIEWSGVSTYPLHHPIRDQQHSDTAQSSLTLIS